MSDSSSQPRISVLSGEVSRNNCISAAGFFFDIFHEASCERSLIDYARGGEAAIAHLAAHDDEATSTIVLSELYRGLLITQGMTPAEAMSKYEWVEPVPFTNETAAEAAEIDVELRAAGEMVNKSDIYIAGTARALGVPLVVGDDHFAAVDGLDVETYRA